MANAITNPLYGLKVGSIAFGEPPHFDTPVLGPGLTKFISGQSGEMSMSGSSEYIYSDQMNQGSVGVSGSYGISGIAKFSSKLSGYYGHTEANSGKTLSIMLNVTDWAGVEYVDFNDISAAELMAGMFEGPRAKLTTALDKFVAMQKALGVNSDPGKLVGERGTLKPEAQAWILAVEDFYRSCGTGFVMGVLWGGWGTAKLEFHTTGEENRWKYGGSGNFTRAGTGATVSISAAYGGSKSTISQNASAKITVFYNGACVQAKVEQWLKELSELASKGLTALGSTEVTRNATLAAPIEAPTIPDFVTPKKDPKVTDLFKEITSLDGLRAYAQAAAWQKQKDASKTESLQDFLKKADEKNDVSGVPDDDTLSPLLADSSLHHLRAEPPHAASREEPPKPADVTRYEPLGVWIVNWAQLFPWLVTGHDNAVLKGAQALEWIRLKTLYQDCLTLTRLYDRLVGEGCSVLVDGKTVDFHSISDSFSHVAALIGDFLATRPAVTGVSDRIRSFISQMSADARNIYAKWDEVPHFRRCELGAGVIFEYFHESNSTVSDLNIQGSGMEIRREPCPFQIPNYSAFAPYGKAWPFITPNGRILAFVSTGSASTSGILTIKANDLNPRGHVWNQLGEWTFTFAVAKQTVGPPPYYYFNKSPSLDDPWLQGAVALSFNADQSSPGFFVKYSVSAEGLGSVSRSHHLYPIPFDAAAGISNWKGCAMATGMGTLGKDLQALKDELSKLKRCTFDDDFWAGVSFTGTDQTKDLFYSMEMMKLSYIGVTEEPPNIMPGRRST
jgi:hypothetical protein